LQAEIQQQDCLR